MDILIQQVVSGLATGGIYASLALALVMIYQATDVVNFAQGEMAMFSTYLAWTLINAGVPYWVAFFATLAIAFVGGLVIERVVIRPVENAPILTIVIVMPRPARHPQQHGRLDLLLHPEALPEPVSVQAHPGSATSSSAPTTSGAIGVTLVVLALLFVFFRFTTLGLAMRAAAQNPGVEPALRHPRGLDARARLGAGRRRSARWPA